MPTNLGFEDIVPSKFILVLGAGFSKPFGGLVANDLTDMVRNRLQKGGHSDLVQVLQKSRSYELALGRLSLRKDPISIQRRSVFEECVYEVFDTMDKNQIRSCGGRVQFAYIPRFLNLFAGADKANANDPNAKGPNSGFIFTLNQDLLVERFWPESHPWTSALPWVPHSQVANMNGGPLFRGGPHLDLSQYRVNLEAAETWNRLAPGQVHLVKLHGSINWYRGSAGRSMVMGTRKYASIRRDPLLARYFELFRHVLNFTDRHIVVIGYSFRDRHINEILYKAVEQRNAKVFLWDPDSSNIIKRLEGDRHCSIGGRIIHQIVSGSIEENLNHNPGAHWDEFLLDCFNRTHW